MVDPASDEVLDALAAVVEVLETSRNRVEVVDTRAQELRTGRSRGASYAELLTGATGPLVIDVLSELLDGLFDAGSRLRRAEARALHAEGLSMDKIGLLMRVSRQRVSAIINSSFGEGDAYVGHDRRRSAGSRPVRGSVDDQRRDEHDLRRAEREASQSRSLLEALYESAPVGFGLIDDAFRIVRMNQHLAAVNGAPLEDQIGRTIAELVPDLWPAVEPALRQVRETGEAVVHLEVRRLPAPESRTARRWLASCYPVRLEADVLGIGLVVVDLT